MSTVLTIVHCPVTYKSGKKRGKLGGSPPWLQESQVVFLSEEMENNLSAYIKKAAAIFYGITIDELQILTYKLAVANEVEDIPQSWTKNEKAGIDWAKGFLERHNEISLRTTESTSIQRMVNLNEVTGGIFFEKLEGEMVGLALTKFGMLMRLVLHQSKGHAKSLRKKGLSK